MCSALAAITAISVTARVIHAPSASAQLAPAQQQQFIDATAQIDRLGGVVIHQNDDVAIFNEDGSVTVQYELRWNFVQDNRLNGENATGIAIWTPKEASDVSITLTGIGQVLDQESLDAYQADPVDNPLGVIDVNEQLTTTSHYFTADYPDVAHRHAGTDASDIDTILDGAVKDDPYLERVGENYDGWAISTAGRYPARATVSATMPANVVNAELSDADGALHVPVVAQGPIWKLPDLPAEGLDLDTGGAYGGQSHYDFTWGRPYVQVDGSSIEGMPRYDEVTADMYDADEDRPLRWHPHVGNEVLLRRIPSWRELIGVLRN